MPFTDCQFSKRLRTMWMLLIVSAIFSLNAFSQNAPLQAPLKSPTTRVVLVPLDDRPATTQFAEMIGRIGNAEVVMPRREILGTFITPGKCEEIAKWLRNYDFSKAGAVILSADMLAYGGFMNSRFSATSLETARQRLEIIREIKRKNPRLPVYAFNVVRRVALSAFAGNRSYRDKITRWAILKDETVQKPNDAKLKEEFERLEREIPPAEITDYVAVRRRNLQVNYAMLDLAKAGIVDKLLLLQDDAHQYGLHRLDNQALLKRIKQLALTDKQAVLYNGADEGGSVLLSRAVLQKNKFTPRVRVVYSSEAGRTHLGDFEDQPIEMSVIFQLENSGAKIVTDRNAADYTLYVNAPSQTDEDFRIFTAKMIEDIKSGHRVAIADVLYKVFGGGDQRLVDALGKEKLLDRVIGYASWGTPGNAIGTVAPQANMYVYARLKLYRDQALAKRIEADQIKFLFHRWVGDFGYHTLVRQDVNRYARQDLKIEVDDLNPSDYEKFNKLVSDKMTTITKDFFNRHFKNRFYQTGANSKDGIVLQEMENLQIRLPWVRTFEIFMDFNFRYAAPDKLVAKK